MCTSSVELETHSNGRVLGIGQIMVWTSHVDSEYGDLSSCAWLCYFYLDDHCYFIIAIFLLLLVCIYLIMAYLSIVSS
jgi:hypothetical protein